MTAYLLLKHLHVTCVVISITGFFLRGIWMLRDSPLLDRLWVRVVPHVNDTLLLVAAVGLSIVQQQYPFVHGWVTAKVLGLLGYIGFGLFALRDRIDLLGGRIEIECLDGTRVTLVVPLAAEEAS